MKLEIAAFSEKGVILAERLVRLFPDSCAAAPEKYCRSGINPVGSLNDWTKARFKTGSTLVFISAAGVAVRAVAPFVNDKASDAAVICIDELGLNVIPLLSGHLGGANKAAIKLAEVVGANAVITTATDLNGVFAADDWARENNCAIKNKSEIKRISSKLLGGGTVGLISEFEIEGSLPQGIVSGIDAEDGIEISLISKKPFKNTLNIIPRVIVAGIGCRKGASADALEAALLTRLGELNIPAEAVGTVASINIKAEEAGLLTLCEKLGARFVTFCADELMSAEGEFQSSERVLRITGADNVCERAAVLAGGEIISGKSRENGVAIAIGRLKWKAVF